MADRIQIDEIKQKLDIVEVARKYIRADFKNSGRNTFTLCPFHNEKSPSFSLNSELGIYKCFGCGESGDVIKLIEKLEGVDFPRAVELAADIAGIVLKQNLSPKDKELAAERKRAHEIVNTAAEFFHFLLMKHESGEHAREYVRSRKIRKKEVVDFKLGFAPNGFENLKKYMLKKGFKETELIKEGLLVSKNTKVYDKFRNRLMFPIANHRGEIVGFSGRTLEKDGIPKYLNSPETSLYVKSQVVYGLYQARESIRKTDFAIIAEGNVEPLTSRKADIDNVVVPMGTSLTLGQLKLIQRFTDNIYFAFDTDTAGFAALQRNSLIALKEGFNIKVINLGKFKDPDEMISENVELWKNAVVDATDLVDFLINKFIENLNLNSGPDKSKLVKMISPFLKNMTDQVQFEHYINKLAGILNVSAQSIRNGLKNDSFEVKEEVKPVQPIQVESTLDDYLVSLLINFPNVDADISGLKFSSFHEKILKYRDMLNNAKEIRDNLNDEEKPLFDNLVMMNIPKFDTSEASKEIAKEIKKLKQVQARSKLGNLKDRMKVLESTGGNIDDLLKEIDEQKIQLKD